MERKFYTDDFEQLLREKSDEFRMYPSKRVWHSIYNDLHPGRKWPSVAMSMLLVISLLLIGYLNNSDSNSNIASHTFTSTQGKNGNINTGLSNKPAVQDLTTIAGNSLQTEPGGFSLFTQVYTALDNLKNIGSGNVDSRKLSLISLSATEQKNTDSQDDNQYTNKNENIIESVDYYIRTNRLFADVAANNRKGLNTAPALTATVNPDNTVTTVGIEPVAEKALSLNQNARSLAGISSIKSKEKEDNKTVLVDESTTTKAAYLAVNKKTITPEDKAWMEDYAFHNKSGRKKWKDKLTMELYATPSIGYRNLSSNVQNEVIANSLATSASAGAPLDKTISQKPSLGLEAGAGFSYTLTKNILLKAGVQLNYTNYGINADETNHPILTTLMLNDPNTGNPYLSSRTSTLSNSSGLQPVTLHNKTYQFSIPVGAAIKLAGNQNMSWYVGGSIQPTLVFGGTANLISSDYKNYISDVSLIRRWNMNTAVETYINYKMGGYNLQVGPQLRYQMLSTYDKKYTFNEKLYNMGLKVGFVKNF